MDSYRIWFSIFAILSFLVFPWYIAVIILVLGNIFIEKYWASLAIALAMDFLATGGFVVGYVVTDKLKMPLILFGLIVIFTIRNTLFKQKNLFQ